MIDIKRFCFEMGLSQAGFADKIGVDQSVVSHMTRGTRRLRQDHIEKLESIYGKEQVDKYRIEEVEVVSGESNVINLRRLAFDANLSQSALGDILGLPQSEVSKLMNGRRDITQAHVDMLIAHFGAETIAKYALSEDAVAAVTRPIAKQTEATIVPANVVEEAKAEAIEEYKAEESVPFLATDVVTASINVRKYVEKNSDEMDSIDPSKLLNNPDVAEMITGTSMLPTFAPNDVVFIKFLPDRSQLIDGKMYYFDLANLPTMIRKVKFEDDDHVRLIAKNPAYADVVIEREKILNIGKVVGMFRETFGDQYDEIDEIRKQKDTQIDNLIKQNTKALDSIGELISVIKNK